MQQDLRQTNVQRATEYFRREIIRGNYAPMAKLPSVVSGAELVGVHRLTIAEAYKRLADDGLVEIKRSVGAFVKSQLRKAEYAFFAGAPQVQHSHTESLNLALSERVYKHGQDLRVHVVQRGPTMLPRFLETVQTMADGGHLSGAFMINLVPEWVLKAESILAARGIPVVHFSNSMVAKYSISSDNQKAIRGGTRWLAKTGCAKIVRLSYSIGVHPAMDEAFVATCEALEIAHDSINRPMMSGSTAADFELLGKELGEKIVRLASPPDGVLITDDWLGRGVLSAFVRAGVDVPGRMKICTFARKGDSYPSVFDLPVACLVSDAAVSADAGCDMMSAFSRGENPAEPHVRVPLELQLPESDMEPCLADELATGA